MKTNKAGINLIKKYEGFSTVEYICPAGFRTTGYGHRIPKNTVYFNPLTEEQAERLLIQDLRVAEVAVAKLIKVPLTENQFSALVSFVFNLGAGRLQASTLRFKLNRGAYISAAGEFRKWVFGGGRKLPGLILRRAAETELFLKDITLDE